MPALSLSLLQRIQELLCSQLECVYAARIEHILLNVEVERVGHHILSVPLNERIIQISVKFVPFIVHIVQFADIVIEDIPD